jgi:uncharacterized protein YcfL
MRKFLVVSLLGLTLAGCNAQAQADATAVAEYVCTTAQALSASGLVLSDKQTTALNSVINACNVTAGGSNLTQASAVAAIFAGLVTLQQGGLLNGIKMKALSPTDIALIQHKYALPQSTVDWIITHDFK